MNKQLKIWLGVQPPHSFFPIERNASLNLASLPAKLHVNLSYDLSRVNDSDRRQTTNDR